MRKLVALFFTAFVLVAAAAPVPPVDARCASDADCGVTFRTLAPGPTQCCWGCPTTAGSKTWVARVEATCRAYEASEHPACPPLACPQGQTRTTCDHGTCKLAGY